MKIRYNFDEVKKITLILFSLIAFCIKAQKSTWISYDLYLGDTVNVIENNNIKQGRWVLLGKDKKGRNYKFYKGNQLVETGQYKNDKREGVWRAYHSSGKLGSEINYLNDVANGPAKFYSEDGKIIAEGVLNGKDYVGEYFIYDKNGNKFKKFGNKKRSICLFGI